MNKSIWMDRTLNTAVRRQLSSDHLAELTRLLATLGIKQSVIDLDARCRYLPRLANVQKHLALIGMLDLGSNLKLAEQAGLKQVIVTCNATGQAEFEVRLQAVMDEADKYKLRVSLLLEDLVRLTIPELSSIMSVIKRYPVAAIIYSDRGGKSMPFALFDQIAVIKNSLTCPVGIWAGNAYGLATANTLAALKAGACQAVVSIGGIGGDTPWEEAIMLIRQLAGQATRIPHNLSTVCGEVLALLGLPVPVSKAIIGPAIFAHESGLHVDGVNKDPEIYEPFAPELVGLSRQFIVGKHSGTAALRTKFAAWGIRLEEAESKRLLASVRALAVHKKMAISDHELKNLYLSS